MKDQKHILQLVKKKVRETEPGATLILYGSHARGEQRDDSDLDILILVERENEKMTWDEKMKVISAVSRLEWETGANISPVVYSKLGWTNHKVTPFYENVNREGIVL